MTNSQKTIPKTGEIAIGTLLLTSGELLEDVSLHYEISGPEGAPVILVCHALTGNQHTIGTDHQPGWWNGLIGEGNYVDTEAYQVLTFNVLGGCHGSTGPTTNNKRTNLPYRSHFPHITVRDMVHAQQNALKKLGIQHLAAVMGGSLGGMQAMEWGILYPNIMDKIIVLASTPVYSDYGIAYNHIAETSIIQDSAWDNGNYISNTDLKGLEIARMVGMVTYRSAALFNERFERKSSKSKYDVNAYLDHQGKKLTERFDANSYLTLLRAMNDHDIGKDRGGWEAAARNITLPILAISYDRDLIFEPSFMKKFAGEVVNGSYVHVETDFGHDGFLTEFPKWGPEVEQFLNG
ncbi:homoserine O-acetyltransferase MetX [Oceanobacillus manasiensis]|uniref:homoserine O-acetyltransferase MetX n=1 Tax=Oceanobacillus manasiensis TaxID=586413 RepID=UPI0005AB2CCB|nr:homoserine O-acetyltransferase [Oceanobacillus manasiensis]